MHDLLPRMEALVDKYGMVQLEGAFSGAEEVVGTAENDTMA